MAALTVKLIEASRVSPPQTLVNRHSSLALTALDMLFLGFLPVERLFFYEPPQPSTDFHDLVHQLKNSLSLALQYFYLLAGKLYFAPEIEKPEIRFNDGDYVSFLVAETDADFYHLSGDHSREESSFQNLIPPLPVSDSPSPVLSLQVTGFRNGGYCVGVSLHHAVADGRSFVHFVKCWAELSRKSGKTETPILTLDQTEQPYYSRETLWDLIDLEKKLAGGFLKYKIPYPNPISEHCKISEPRFERTTFFLSRSDVLKLKQLVITMQKPDLDQMPVSFSAFVITCAYTWVCWVRSRKFLEEQQKVGFAFMADCRSRLDPSLPASYFGNCISVCHVEAIISEILGENGFSVAATVINDAVTGLSKGPFRDAESWIPRALDLLPERFLSVAGSPRFGVYEIDFGWGKPKKVEVVSIGKTGAISLAESRDGGGGVEIGLSQPRSEMEMFASHFVGGLKVLV